jgi:hypothetical protein
MSPRVSRPARLQAVEVELRALAGEYQHWLSALPANLADSALAADLEQASEQLEDLADELSAIDLPRIGR